MGSVLSSYNQGAYVRKQLRNVDRKFLWKSIFVMLLLYLIIVIVSIFAISWWSLLVHSPIIISVLIQLICIYNGSGAVVRALIIVTEINIVCAIVTAVISAIRLLIFCSVDYGCIIGTIALGIQFFAEVFLVIHLFVLYTNVLSVSIYQTYLYQMTIYLLRSMVGANNVPQDVQQT